MKIDLFFYFLSLCAVKKSNKPVIYPFVAANFKYLNGFLYKFQFENEVFIKKNEVAIRSTFFLRDFKSGTSKS